MNIKLNEREIGMLKQYAAVYDSERKLDSTADPIVVVEDYEDGYTPVAYFLTRAEASSYIKYQGHNLSNPRVYTKNCGYSNFGDLTCLTALLLRMGEQLNKG